MNKAFVKENDNDNDDDSSDEGNNTLPVGTKNYITPKGADKLQAELRSFLNEERPKIVEIIAWAASNGDRSENADYIYGKRRLREIDRRIRFLTKRLEKVEIIDPTKQSGDKVLFGATVTVIDEDGAKKVFKIVGIDETEPTKGKISWISPIGKALLQNKTGDAVTINTPQGEIEYEISKVEYIEIF